MTDLEIRTAIAEACGWVENSMGPKGTLHDPKGCTCFDGPGCKIPDYPSDLNAMNEAEVALEQHMQIANTYWTMLSEAVGADDDDLHTSTRYRYIGNATARQRAEAFLRTVGKWKD